MKQTLASAAVAVALLLSTSIAQAESRAELARQYIELPSVQRMVEDMFSPEAMLNQLKVSLPRSANVSDSKKRRMSRVLSQGMKQLQPSFEKIMISESARVFTKAELKALVVFYSSKEGASILAKMPQFMDRSMTKLAPQMQKVQKAVEPALHQIIRD